MVGLSFIWLIIVIVELIWGASVFLELFGAAIWAIFLLEFLLRYGLAPRKLAFLRHNWLTVLALLVPAFRILRLARVLRVARAARSLRLIRIVGTANRGMNALRRSMARRGCGYILLLTVIVALLGAAGMWAFENDVENRPFENYAHALWWTAMILASMGTDYWPQTAEGRILSLMLAMYGFAIFGYITAALATFFVGQEMGKSKDASQLAAEISRLRETLAYRPPSP
jgi:voltage-gated potassium channel